LSAFAHSISGSITHGPTSALNLSSSSSVVDPGDVLKTGGVVLVPAAVNLVGIIRYGKR